LNKAAIKLTIMLRPARRTPSNPYSRHWRFVDVQPWEVVDVMDDFVIIHGRFSETERWPERLSQIRPQALSILLKLLRLLR
jgi:hypothetical protein